MKRSWLVVMVSALILFLALYTSAQDGIRKSRKQAKAKTVAVSFSKDVFPLIKKFCLPCHTEDQMNPSELYMEGYDGIMAGGKHGKPIVPGNADSSLIIRKLSPKPPFGDPMPLKAKILPTEAEIKILREWIKQGAKNN